MSVPFLISRQFDDFDEFCVNAQAWDLDYKQIEGGTFNGYLLLASTGGLQFTRSRLGRRLIQKGAPPQHLTTFGLLADSEITMFWRGQQVSGDQMFVFPKGGELDCVSQSDFDVFAVSIAEQTLSVVCQSLRLPEPHELLGGKEVFSGRSDDLHLLRQFLLGAQRQLLVSGTGLPNCRILQEIEFEAAGRFMSFISRDTQVPIPGRRRQRETALARATDYVDANYGQSLNVPKLCQVAHVSERTLEYAFRERYGVTPKRFVTAYRLNAAKKALLFADPGDTTVGEVALNVGFWHMGQFAADYSNLFGELPSKTLQRSIR